jgi:hypothetical protein
MRGLLEHRCESEELSLCGLIDNHFLMFVVNGCDSDRAGHHDISAAASVTHFVNALAWGKRLDFDLAGQDRGFLVVE